MIKIIMRKKTAVAKGGEQEYSEVDNSLADLAANIARLKEQERSKIRKMERRKMEKRKKAQSML